MQVLFVRACRLSDNDLEAIKNSLKANTSIKVIDISSNTDLSGEAVSKMGEVLDENRTLEYFGLAKLNLENEHVVPLISLIGKFPFPADQVESHLAELKKRDAIVEKNKKLKASKKPEEPVPQLDDIEQISKKNEDGETEQVWVTIKNSQFKHFNFCMNNIDDDIEPALENVLKITNDSFGVTMSSNKINEELAGKLHEMIRKQHGLNIELQI